MALIKADKLRGLTRDITILDAAGGTITVSANDMIRAIIGREGKLGADLTFPDAQFFVASGTNTPNGSSFTPNSPSSGKNRLRIDASDLNFAAGVYSLIIDHFDNANAAEWATVSRQVFSLEDT